ncbi:VCBS repeat-containing protein, partial [Arthrospira platensis SPKY1]|nr:VCBS repeat-containing protein [Arthrospira platensis SPKY1]
NPGFFFAVPTDLDSDGDMDVLVSRSNPATTFWYENLDGSGSFSALQVIPDLNVTASFYLDFDHDGREDLIVRNNDGIFWCKKLEEGPDFGAAIPILAPLPFSF